MAHTTNVVNLPSSSNSKKTGNGGGTEGGGNGVGGGDWSSPYTAYHNGILKKVTTVHALNSQFALLEAPGNPAAIIHRKTNLIISERDLGLRLENQIVKIGEDKDGKPIWLPARNCCSNANRHVYDTIVFSGALQPSHTYNLFNGFGVLPNVGDCSLIKQHILEVVCAGNTTNYEAMLSLIAWQMQNVGVPSRIIVVLMSEQHQTGKGSLLEGILLPIWGNAGYKTSAIETIIGRFNSHAIRGKGYIFLDEALYVGNFQAADKVKSLAASQRSPIDEKFLPALTMPIGINFWLASNHRVPVRVEEKDARYWGLRVAEHCYQDHAYFAQLYSEIVGGGLSAFLHEMLARDVTGFIPQRDVPFHNEVHKELIKGSLNPADPRIWLEECVEVGYLLSGAPPDGDGNALWIPGQRIESMRLWQSYRGWVGRLREFGLKTAKINDFWTIVTRMGFELRREAKGNWRRIPTTEFVMERLGEE